VETRYGPNYRREDINIMKGMKGVKEKEKSEKSLWRNDEDGHTTWKGGWFQHEW